jgi:uncharacterized metal-binding protein
MPDGLAHASASVVIAWSPWMIWMANNIRPILPAVTIETAMAISIGSLAGILISPDLDLEERTYGKGILWRSNGLVGAAWAALWWPYSQIVQHRSILSHGPIIGTLLRLAYLVTVPLLAWAILSAAFHWPAAPAPEPILWWLQHPGRWFVLGLALSDAAHWAMDNLF